MSVEHIEKLTMRQLYRGILQYVKHYPSKNRAAMREAILEDVRDWKKLQEEIEVKKAQKKMRMLYAHLYMYHLKMEEVNSTTSGAIDRPLPFQDFNRRRDDNFVYF
jgi:hypothetical protein